MKTIIMAGLAAVTLAMPAFAHTQLKSTVPADGSTVAAAPAEFVLTFMEPARLTAVSVQKDGATEQKITALPNSAVAEARVAVPKLENGRYTLAYRMVGADGHVMNGKIAFTIGGKSAPGTAAPHADHDAHSGH